MQNSAIKGNMISEKEILLAKDAAGKEAAKIIENGMIVGLGTGSTALQFIDHLIQRCKNGLTIQAVASSNDTASYAEKGGIPVIDLDEVDRIHITVDGADEVDTNKQMIKGGGGALLREKILATSSQEMVVIIDPTKYVNKLGTRPLAVEITPFGHLMTVKKIQALGYSGKLRMTSKKNPYMTDNGNYIYDIQFSKPVETPALHHKTILSIPGVVETGFFIDIAGRVIMGHPDGTVKILP